jgi:hypothetical protein
MSEQKKKKSLASLHKDIKAIRQRKPTDAQIDELKKVLDKENQKDKRRIARSPEVES